MDIEELQKTMRSLEEALVLLYEKKSNKECMKSLKKLEDFKPDVNPPQMPQLPEHLINKPVSVDVVELRNELRKRIKLMEILIMKANCPISKVVDQL